MSQRLACFKAYDVRGKVPEDLNEELAEKIGRAYAAVVKPKGPVVVGYDIRESSPDLAGGIIRGLNQAGAESRCLGQCGTEVVYHAAARPGYGGGIMVTASHNPKGDNGLKMVRAEPARGVILPVTAEYGLDAIEQRVRTGRLPSGKAGGHRDEDVMDSYLQRVKRCLGAWPTKPLKIVVNAGNGAAGPFVDRLAEHLPFDLVRIHHEPDGTFPNGVPNPLLPENREATANAVREHGADLGVAWDGDFDRCFLFDHTGGFVEGYYIVGLLAERLLASHPGGLIVHDPRLYWNTVDVVQASKSGAALKCRTGHARIKAMMVERDALYGGEMSAHHYFREFAYCDSGMVPWLLIADRVANSGKPLKKLVEDRLAKYPCSGEINRTVAAPDEAFNQVLAAFAKRRPAVDYFDGLSMTFRRWRCNLRQSDTQPELLRLNVESQGSVSLMEDRTAEILALLDRL